jgi:hypothetical protein
VPSPRKVRCTRCGKPVIFAVVSNKRGEPRKRMPLDPSPDPGGNVAVMQDVTGTLTGRVLGKTVAMAYEAVHMPHFPTTTCKVAARLPFTVGDVTYEQWSKADEKRSREAAMPRGQHVHTGLLGDGTA